MTFSELLLEAIVQIEPSEADEERDEARATEAEGRRHRRRRYRLRGCRTPGLSLPRIAALRPGRNLDGPRGRYAAPPEPPRTTALLPGYAQQRRTQDLQLPHRPRERTVASQVCFFLYFYYHRYFFFMHFNNITAPTG